MKTKLSYFWELISGSFWFIPLSIIILAILSAFGLIYLDIRTDYVPSGLMKYFFSGGAESARSILSTTAGAMITVAGTVFSITLVALTLASSQFGPRLLQNFMHDRINQVVLGSYIATFIFCLLILRTVKSDTSAEFVPNISVLFTVLIAIVNIFLLVIFIHHISVSIQADHVISDINMKLHTQIRKLFPEEMGGEKEKPPSDKELSEIKKAFPEREELKTTRSGYLQAVNNEGLMQAAVENDLLIMLQYQPGDFLTEKQHLVTVCSRGKLGETAREKIQRAFILGNKRTATQDAEFAIHQMVEIAARALSPGINDPYTAITCIDYLTATLCYLTRSRFPSAYRYDDQKHLRVITKPLTFEGMMDAAFNQIRQYGENTPAIIIRLMESCITIHESATLPKHRKTVEKHVEMLYNSARDSIKERNDFKDLKERYKKFKA